MPKIWRIDLSKFKNLLPQVQVVSSTSKRFNKESFVEYAKMCKFSSVYGAGMRHNQNWFCSQDFYNATGGVNIDEALRDSTLASPAFEWHQYLSGESTHQQLYPHWSTADFCMFPSTCFLNCKWTYTKRSIPVFYVILSALQVKNLMHTLLNKRLI